MMTNNRNQAASSASHHGGNDKNAAYPQSPCGAPMISKGTSSDVDVCSDMVAKMTVAAGNGAPVADVSISSAKENVRPNSGNNKKKWRKKLNQNQRRVAASGDDGSTAAAAAAADDSRAKNSAEEKQDNHGKKLQKAVVVEISSQNTTTPDRPILPPTMDYRAAVDAGATAMATSRSSPTSSLGNSGGRVKKSRPNKNRKHPKRFKPKAKKGGSPAHHSTAPDQFSTNAGGASVLALLGQYPYVMPTPSMDGQYHDGPSTPPSPEMMMAGGCDGYQAQYDPSNYPTNAEPQMYAGNNHAYGMQYSYPAIPIAAPDMNQGATVLMPASYYVPVMTHYNGAVYYNQQQQTGSAAEYTQAYYPTYYCPYEPMEQHAPAQPPQESSDASSSGGKALNIDAPAFNPKENHDE